MKCFHDWKVISKEVLPSAFEQMKGVESIKGDISYTFQKKIIIILACTKCGKLDKTIETTYS